MIDLNIPALASAIYAIAPKEVIALVSNSVSAESAHVCLAKNNLLLRKYGKFPPQRATLEQPLTELLAKDAPFEWTERCEKAFTALKEKLALAYVLVHCDAKLPLRLACDASAYGLGAVLSHIMSDGSERPVAFAPKTMTATERKYSQIEKEAYALKFGVTKFAQYLYGRRFTLVTDYRPLVTIFGKKASLSAIVADRIQLWAVPLSMQTFDIEYISSSANENEGGLSRLPLDLEEDEESIGLEVRVSNAQQIASLTMTTEDLARETREDAVLSKVGEYIEEGWPAKVGQTLQKYRAIRENLTYRSGANERPG